MTTVLNFGHGDSVTSHFRSLVSPTLDPLIKAKYAGFVAVAAVCVYEMAVKEIFTNFAAAKHPILASMTREHFERINGRVKYEVIKKDYVPLFGTKYSVKFSKNIERKRRTFLNTNGSDFITAYNNVVIWRNAFVHGANVPSTATFQEVAQSYEDGKELIVCLNLSMAR